MSSNDLFAEQMAAMAGAEDRPLSVGGLTRHVKDLLEGAFPSVWVTGEISNLSRPQSGHCYLTLKDDAAQIRGVLWRTTAAKLSVPLTDGLEVVCQGSLDVYAPRGTYQLVIRRLFPKGVGALEQALRRLKQKLAAEGLFDAEHKQALPPYPRRIAVVTSPTGAAIHDFLQVLRRRSLGIEILVVPVRVQGDGAADEIARAIETVNRMPIPFDVLVVGRGGGSLEDLWAFNEEPVVRAIHASRIPVVSAVGHEIDVTLSDLVADLRALTPTEAAERVVPDRSEMKAALDRLRQRLTGALRGRSTTARATLDAIASRPILRNPYNLVHDRQRRLDELSERMQRGAWRSVPTARQRVDALSAQLESLSPLNVLQRGYSVTRRVRDGQVVVDAGALTPGDQLLTQLAHGQVVSTVEEIHKGERANKEPS